jgi:RNA polymerase sigma factor (sigma-70 family)
MARSRKSQIVPQADVPEPEDGLTSPTLLDRVRDWRDHPAWMAFFERYNPLLRRWCGRFGLDADASDEVCQRVWVELMARMRTFRYDPSRGFRNWLWRLFRSRAIDLLRKRRTSALPSVDELPLEAMLPPFPDAKASEDTAETKEKGDSLVLHRLAIDAQDAVRSRVEPDTWRAYWFVAIEDRPFREAAESLGKTYTAVYNGYKRVDRMLRIEGERRLAALLVPGSPESDSRQR